jgi:hypothetical protein
MIKRRLELWGLACDTLLFRLSFFCLYLILFVPTMRWTGSGPDLRVSGARETKTYFMSTFVL